MTWRNGIVRWNSMAATRRISRGLALNSDEISQELKPERTEKAK